MTFYCSYQKFYRILASAQVSACILPLLKQCKYLMYYKSAWEINENYALHCICHLYLPRKAVQSRACQAQPAFL